MFLKGTVVLRWLWRENVAICVGQFTLSTYLIKQLAGSLGKKEEKRKEGIRKWT